jgi:hypothetical protein
MIVIVPRVAMIGGIWIFELRNPFNRSKGGTNQQNNNHGENQCIEDWSPTAIAAERASSEPTEMSNPPPIMTKVEPISHSSDYRALPEYVYDVSPKTERLGVISEMTSANTNNAMMILYVPRKLANLDLTAGPDIQLTT